MSTVFFASYLVGLRDGLEAALVVTILLTVLARSQRRDALAPLWAGVGAAVLGAAALGAVLTYVATSLLSGVRLEVFEAATSLIAVAMVTWMIFWMRRSASTIKADLTGKLSDALGMSRLAVAGLAFVAVVREGVEMVLLVFSAAQAAAQTVAPLLGMLAGVASAVLLGWLMYAAVARVNLGRLRSDETALWCFGPHDLSMIDHILGEQPVSVSACGTAVLQPGIEDVVFVTLRYASGILANLHLSWLSPRKERRFTLVCSQKMVELDDVSPEKLRIYDKGYDRPPEFTQFGEFLTIRDGDVHIPKVAMEEPLRAELRHFLDCIERGQPAETSFAQGVRVTAILEAAERSLAAGGTPLPVASLASDSLE